MNLHHNKNSVNIKSSIAFQKGYTLVTILILSSLASILVLTSLKDNITQERLSGNYQKKINARLASERGVYESIQNARDFLQVNPDITLENVALLTEAMTVDQEGLLSTKYRVLASFDEATGLVTLSSQGNRFEGQETLEARLRFRAASAGAAFENAVVGCEGVDLSGSGQVDSYNSSVTGYDSLNPGAEGNVSTIKKGQGNIVLGGNSPVYGNIMATGNINTAGSDVQGSLHANKDIIIGSGGGVRVTGNILTRGSYYQNGGKIGGYVRVNGSAYMGWSMQILNLANNGLDILYGGLDENNRPLQSTFKDTSHNAKYHEEIYKVFPNVAEVKSDDVNAPHYDGKNPAANCDHLDIAAVVETVEAGSSHLSPFESVVTQTVYTIKPSSMYITEDIPLFASVNVNVLGKLTDVIKFSSFNLAGSASIIIDGDVTLFVEGSFNTAGATVITIKANSSLTLITKGQINLGSGAKIIAKKHGLTTTNLPAMSIYSSYENIEPAPVPNSGPGIKMSGAFETYAQIYAPLSDIEIAGSGTLYGAVRGKKVKVSGAGKIHYDAALGKGDRGGSYSTIAKVEFLGMTY